MSLQKLSPTTTRRISSCQAISSVSDAVKELVENALDSGASAINVKLVNYGLARIEVQDDGSGVPSSDVEHMCLPHYTSKIKDFSDLGSKLETYGFRGEALASLCNIADVEITTRTLNDKFASCFTFDKNGKILDSKPSHFKKGTTVVVSNLFSNVPVRRKFISSSNKAKTEFKKTEVIVKNFAIINSGVYFSFFHNKCMVWQKSPAQTLKESLKGILGYPVANQLEEISTDKNKNSIVLVVPRKDCKDMATLCFASVDVMRTFINQRPVRYSKLQKIVLNCIAEYFGVNYPNGKYPISVVSIKVAASAVDVNIESNKSKVMCHDESDLFESVEEFLRSYYTLPSIQCKTKPSGLEEEKNKSCSLQSKQLINNAVEQIDQTLSDCQVAMKVPNQNPLQKPGNENLWASADKAMSLWSVKNIEPNNINKNERLLDVEERSGNKSSEEWNITKRPRLEGEVEQQPINFGSKETDNLNTLAFDQQNNSDCDIAHVINPNSEKRPVLSMQTNDLWASTDKAMGLWSRGCVKSESGDVIEGGAHLLQLKCSTRNESTRKTIEASSAKCKLNLQNSKSSTSQSKILNSSFHTVSSQMGCKEKSGFVNFCREMRPKILAEKPGICFTEVARVLSNKWKALSSEEQNSFSKNVENTNVTISNVQNRSLHDMFKTQTKKKIMKSTTFQVLANDWKISQAKIDISLADNSMTFAKQELFYMLPKGIWICRIGKQVGIVHPWCLQETIIYKQLMETQSVPVILLDKPLLIKKEELAPELWQAVTDLEVEKTNSNTFQVVCPIVIKNGFNLAWENGELYMTHVASTIRHYGIRELEEILTLKKDSSQLSHCRPVKVAALFENQAVRYSSEKQPIIARKEMMKLLELWSTGEDQFCLHQKPIFRPLNTLPKTSPPEFS
ncbi:hypothetical protein R5R35_004977 [Gryllus longicercus]|uniref:HMG box domain-containing protein n=1 Tax=Gryllus longicercus TaxID=2509291 RepID=A0AAN9VJ40_9ORTH